MRVLSQKVRRRILVAALLLAPATVPMALVAQDMSNEEQKDFLTNFVQDRLSTPERQIRLSNIEGVLGSDVRINEITISDEEGVWLRVNNASLNWNQAALFTGRLEVNSLRADSIEYVRNAIPVEGAVDLPSPEASAFEVPEFPVAIRIGELAVPSVTFGENVFGLGSEISLAGSMTLEGGNLDAALDIIRLDGPGGTLDLDVAYSNGTQEIDLGLALVEPPDGVIANLLNIEDRPSVELTLDGTGPIADLEAQLNLLADGRQALAGTAMIAQGPKGYSITADLGGPLSTLVAEPYRPFFGADTRLTAEALVREGGGFDISSLTLSGGQLDLSASASTTSDNFLRSLDLTAAIADPAGGMVTLPVASPTRIQAAQLQVQFGTTSDENWQSVLAIEDFETDGFAAETFGLNIGGVARNLEDPATRMVTFNGDGTLAGITADPGVEAALGDSVGLGIAGLWNAGQPIELAELRVVGQALTAALAGQIDGADFDGLIQIETDNIAPFSGLAGRDLAGALDLSADGRIMPITGGFDLVFDGTGTNLAIDDPTADALLEGTVTLSGRLARTQAGITAENFSIANAQVQFGADGAFATDVSDFNIALDLADLGLLSDEASGALSVRGSARSTTPDAPLVLMLDGQVPSGQLAGYPLRDAKVNVAANLLDGAISGDITGTALLDGNQAALSTSFETDATQQALSDILFEIAGTRLSGDVTRLGETGLLEGRLALVSPDISLPAALLLTEASGSVDAELVLTPDGETQSAGVNANASNLRISGIDVGSADIAASLDDLFGVPQINGTAKASDIEVAGISITTLDARADQAGDTTTFDAQARLATGTDVDVAGALTPTDDGYRLALDRAELMQGSLSARLASPTSIELGGDRVSLDAIRFNVGSGSITATGTAGETLDVVVDISQLPLSIANAVAPDLGLTGTVNGRAVISGAASDPQVRFQAQANGISAAAVNGFGITPLSVSANGSYRNQVLALESISANGSGGLSVQGSGVVPLNGSSIAVSLTGSAPLELANRFVVDRGGVFAGTAGFSATIGGSLSAPQFSGTVTTAGASYIDPELNLRLTDIAARIGLSTTTATIETLSARLATGGTVSAQGSVGLTGGLPANLAINLNGARYTDGELFVATLSGALNLTGDITGSPLLSGDVLIEEANITVPDRFGGAPELIDVEHVRTPRPVQETLNRARINARTGAAGAPSGELQLDVTIRAPNQIFVRGRGLNAEVGGEVRLTGSVSDIQPVGSFSLTRGRFDVLGQRLDFETGTVTLTGNLDPQLYFVARTEGEGITVFITIAGRVSEPELTFTSNPDLPQDEVLSRLIFNRSVGELSSLQLARLAGAAAELFGGGGNVVDDLREAAGLDDLDIVTDDAGNVGVKAGAYVQDNTYVEITAGTGGQSKVSIELDATDEITVKGSVAADGRSSVGVFYEQDY